MPLTTRALTDNLESAGGYSLHSFKEQAATTRLQAKNGLAHARLTAYLHTQHGGEPGTEAFSRSTKKGMN